MAARFILSDPRRSEAACKLGALPAFGTGTKVQGGLLFSPFLSIIFFFLCMEESRLMERAVPGRRLGSCSREWLASFGAPSPNIKVPVRRLLHSFYCQLGNARKGRHGSGGVAWPKSCLSWTRLPVLKEGGVGERGVLPQKQLSKKWSERQWTVWFACVKRWRKPSPLTPHGRQLNYPCGWYRVANYFPLSEVGGGQSSTKLPKLIYAEMTVIIN